MELHQLRYFVAVAETGTGNRVMTSPDGIKWAARTSTADNNWESVAYGGGLFVAVASTGTGNRVMTWEPEAVTTPPSLPIMHDQNSIRAAIVAWTGRPAAESAAQLSHSWTHALHPRQ